MLHITTVARLWALCGGGLLLLIVAATVWHVTALALHTPAYAIGVMLPTFVGYEDFVSVCVGTAVLMCFPYCQMQNGYIAATVFTHRLSSSALQRFDAIAHVCTIGIAVFLTYWLIVGAGETYLDAATTPVLGWSIWPFYIPAAFSLLLWSIVAINQLRTVRDTQKEQAHRMRK